MAIWDDIIPDSDKRMFSKGGGRGMVGFGKRPAVLVVDMNYGFTDSRYPTGSSEMGKPTAQAIRCLLEAARSKKLPIFFTTSPPRPLPAEKGYWKAPVNYPLAPGLPHPDQIVEELGPREGEAVVTKLRPSAFFGTSLVDMLIFHQVDSLIITGMTTSGCVRATVVDAFSYNYRVIIPQECCGDRAVVSHKVSLFDMHMKYADVVSLEAVLEYLAGLSPR